MKKLFLLAVFCGSLCVASHASAAAPANELRLQLSAEPVSLDSSLAEDGLSFRVFSAMMRGLFRVDETGAVFPDLVASSKRVDGGKRLVLKLAKSQWSDGVAVTAHDFIYAFKRTLSPETPAKLADVLFFVKNAKAYKTGAIKDFALVGIRAPARDTLEFILEKPIGFFEYVLSMPLAYPQRQDVVERAKSAKSGASWIESAPTTGAYRIAEWKRGEKITMVRNPEAYASLPERMVFWIVPEESTALSLFDQGKLDVVFKVAHTDYRALEKRGVLKKFPYNATYYLGFNLRKKAWQDIVTRRALALAINREKVIEALGSKELAASSWIPMGIEGFEPSIGLRYKEGQSIEAPALLKGTELRLAYDAGSRNQLVAERLQSDFKKNLGVNAQLRSKEWKAHVAELASLSEKSDVDLFRFGWLAPFPDAYASLMLFRSDDPNNYTSWKSARYDAILDRIAGLAPLSAQRLRLISEAQKILVEEEVPVVPIYHYVQMVAIAPRVRGFRLNGMGMMELGKQMTIAARP